MAPTPRALFPEQIAGGVVEQERRAEFQHSENDLVSRKQLGQVGIGGGLVPLAPPRPFPLQSPLRSPQKGIIAAFANTCRRWKLSEHDHYVLLGYADNRFLGEQILYGRLAAPQDVRDRVSYVLSISVGLGALFGEDVDAELHWLNSLNPRFANRSAMAFMLDGKMGNLSRVLSEVERARGL